jgi:hypothetical protein
VGFLKNKVCKARDFRCTAHLLLRIIYPQTLVASVSKVRKDTAFGLLAHFY